MYVFFVQLFFFWQQLAATVDIFPTLMKLTGVELPATDLDGFDMSPILFDQASVSPQMQLHTNAVVTLVLTFTSNIRATETSITTIPRIHPQVMVYLL